MEKDFHDRVLDLAKEFFQQNALNDMTTVALIHIISELAVTHHINIDEKDWGSKVSLASRRYQIWFNDPDSFEGGVYGESAESMEEAWETVPTKLQITADIRQVH